MKLLHIYAQEFHHQDALIYGNRESLESLKAAIEQALDSEKGMGGVLCFTTDGEGYVTFIKVANDDWNHKDWKNVTIPYTNKEFFPIADGEYPELDIDEYKRIYNSLE